MSSDPSQTVQIVDDASAQIHYKTSLNDSLSLYDKLMSSVSDSKTAVLTDSELSKEHRQTASVAISCFRGTVKIGHEDLAREFEAELTQKLDKKFEDYKTFNRFKHKNKLDLEEIERLKREQELKEQERVKLEEALRKIREEKLPARLDERRIKREQELKEQERVKLEEALRKIREEKLPVPLDERRIERPDEVPEPEPAWIRIIKGVAKNPVFQALLILMVCRYAYDYVKTA